MVCVTTSTIGWGALCRKLRMHVMYGGTCMCCQWMGWCTCAQMQGGDEAREHTACCGHCLRVGAVAVTGSSRCRHECEAEPLREERGMMRRHAGLHVSPPHLGRRAASRR